MSEADRSKGRSLGGHLVWAVPTAALIVVGVLAFVEPSSSSATAAQTQVFGVTRESGGAVMVSLTPKEFTDGRLVVAMGVTTHTVNDLDRYDLTKIVTLKAAGKEIAPVSAPQLEGHHNAGDLVFPLNEMPDSFAIEIRDLNTPGVRRFSWP